jgi:hypothetical protein
VPNLVPTAEQPARFQAVNGGHAWLYLTSDGWVIEHCIDGWWYACRFGDGTPMSLAGARRLALRHLPLKGHGGLPTRCGGHIGHAAPNGEIRTIGRKRLATVSTRR